MRSTGIYSRARTGAVTKDLTAWAECVSQGGTNCRQRKTFSTPVNLVGYINAVCKLYSHLPIWKFVVAYFCLLFCFLLAFVFVSFFYFFIFYFFFIFFIHLLLTLSTSFFFYIRRSWAFWRCFCLELLQRICTSLETGTFSTKKRLS